MKVAAVQQPGGLDKIVIENRDDPIAGPGQILVKIKANSLNFHDLAVVSGMIPNQDGRIPMSDGAGTVVAVGEGVTEFAVDDSVLSLFFPAWNDGTPELSKLVGVPGDHVDGFAAELVAMPASAFTKAPKGYTMEEAATLPCAALTAWRALVTEAQIKPGDWVLTQGTGGVSIFALQFAKAAGCRVIATSSSDEKLAKLKQLGADHLINYKETPDWGAKARELTGGVGVDEVVEIGGAGTLGQSITACRIGGHISLIGVLAGFKGEVPTAQLFSQNITLKGITVGSKREQEDMIRAIEVSGIKPMISDSFPLDQLKDAFELQVAQKHFGKIVVTI
ncbi:MAG: NADPH:quinone reductase-like Zn-dependent oxidoreductase [Patiriisocius sp.]|jgi:NADPH:quinone reductase-like Zn-dependent oxidoreductase